MSLPPPPPPSGQVPAPPSGSMTCYRHPAREAGRRCTRCGKPACPQCLVQASVGSHCVDCAKAARPDVATRAKYWHARQPAMITMGLIALNLLVFVYTTVRDPRSLGGRSVTIGQVELGLFEAALRDVTLPIRLTSGEVYLLDGPDWYRLVTAGFVHFGIIHVGFNMYLLYMLGNMLEPSMGRIRFLLAYLASLLGGSAVSLMIDSGGVAGGASGGVFGLMGLAAVGYWMRGINPLSTQIGSLLMLNLFITFVFPGISIGGHIGGLVAGAACGFAVVAPGNQRRPTWVTYAAPVAVSVLAVALAVVVVA